MNYKITWTATARNDYFQVIEYLHESWGIKAARKFASIVDKKLRLISAMPKMYPKTEARENLRRCFVVKEVSMYYLEVELDEEIIIIRFYDNRQDPKKLIDSLNNNVPHSPLGRHKNSHQCKLVDYCTTSVQ